MENNPERESRKFIRHDAKIPIEVNLGALVANKKEYLNDISYEGLSFKSRVNIAIGKLINIRIPLLKPIFEAKGKVIWCRKEDNVYNVGVEFIVLADGFKIRMLDQICHIENYKKEIRKKEGRHITDKEAAIEWIKKYADKFPK